MPCGSENPRVPPYQLGEGKALHVVGLIRPKEVLMSEFFKQGGSFFGKLAADEGVQRAIAGVAVATVVAGAKIFIFGEGPTQS